MSISTPPAPKKRGMGCLGCGCLILALLVLLFLALMAGAGYLGYTKIIGLTSATPAAVPTFNGSDDLYLAAKQKIADFDHDVENHQAATIQLSADEINILIAHNPDVAKNNIHAFISLTNDEARVQASVPTEVLSDGFLKGRYANLDTSLGINFDSQAKSVNLIFHTLEFGNMALLGPDADHSSFNQSFMSSFTPSFNQSFNSGIRKNPDGAALLDQAKSIEIKDGQLVIETQ